jgi:hypothetical protein
MNGPQTPILVVLLLWFLVPGYLCAQEIPPDEQPPVFGLVIGCNHSDDPDREPLRYADDDAVQNAGLLTQLTRRGVVILLTRLDDDSRALHPHLKPTAPTRRAVSAAMAKINGLMEKARQEGSNPVFYLFYTGHGDVVHNRGYVNLEDGRFGRKDLLQLLTSSRATRNHVIIDACKSYFLIFDRGAGGKRRSVTGPLLQQKEGLPDNTGVFLSTSSAADSHEWEAFQGGIFSHEVRSAMRGAADLDRDSAITYQEAAGFVWTANAAIPARRYRPAFYVRPPRGESAAQAVFVDLTQATGDWLQAGPGAARHFYVEDGQGLRIVDFHPGAEQQLDVLLPSRRPLFLLLPELKEEVELPGENRIVLAELALSRDEVNVRGAEHVAFRKLFTLPFSPESLNEYQSRTPVAIQAPPSGKPELKWLRRSLGILGTAVAVTGGTMTALSYGERAGVTAATSGLVRSRVNDRIDGYNAAAVSCYAVAGAALTTYLVWTFWPEKEVNIQVLPMAGMGAAFTLEF